MKREDFIKLLEKRNYSYIIENDWLIVNHDGYVYLYNNNLTTLPNNIKFDNNGCVDLYNNNLTSLPDNIKFDNKGYVDLSNNNLTSVRGGNHNREIIVFNTSSGYEIQLGCWRGNKLDTLNRIEEEYGLNSDYYKKVKKAFEEKENK